jgi:uncharacterized membrane protein
MTFVLPFSILGSIYLATAKLFKRKGNERLWTLHLLIGLSFLNISKWVKLTGVSGAVVDIIQLGLLAIFGLRFRIKLFQWCAAVLAVVTLVEAVNSGWMVGSLAVTVYGSIAYLVRQELFSDSQDRTELELLSKFYFTLANIIAGVVIGSLDSLSTSWKALLWAVQLLANTTIALKTRDEYINGAAVVLLVINIPCLFVLTTAYNWLLTGFVVTIFYGFAGYCRMLSLERSDSMAKSVKERFGLVATIMLSLLLWKTIPNSMFSIATGLEGMSLIAIGFALKEKTLRIPGLVLFALMAIHLLFFDLASAPTIARICSFIITGVILVGCSYAYGWFGRKLISSNSDLTGSI